MSTPGPMPCASANPALIKASCVLPRLGPDPRTRRSRLRISAPGFVTETILAEIGIANDGQSTSTSRTIRGSTAITPGRSARRGTTESGARFTPTNN